MTDLTAASPIEILRGKRPVDGFALATVATSDGGARPALVLGNDVVDLGAAARMARVDLVPGSPPRTLLEILENWDYAFDQILEVVDAVEKAGLGDERLVAPDGASHLLAPVTRPSKMIYAAQNYPDHVQEMRAAKRFGFNAVDVDEPSDFKGEKSHTRPYVFLKAPSCLTGPYDDVVLPPEVTQLDWEVELAVVIGRPATRVRAGQALDHVAGFMTTNDLSARNLLFRPDRDRLRSDWFGGKSHNGFAPMGPLFVPACFVPNHLDLRLTLSVNGEVRQDGNTRHLIFSPAEQIEYASHMTTLVPGDILATGTPGGVGQGTNSFLSAGDVVEAEVEGLGVLRNTMVAHDDASSPTEPHSDVRTF